SQVVPEGVFLQRRSQVVAERLRMVELKFAEIPLFVNLLAVFCLFFANAFALCGNSATPHPKQLCLQNQGL
ncbi:MAG: hypothetical protein WBN09_09250, partial [Woeseiaceae bacterium]